MSECKYSKCSNEVFGKGEYCRNAHKQAAFRERNKQPVTGTAVTLESVTDENEGTIGTSDTRSSSTGDPQDTESGGKTIVTDFPHKVVDPRPIEDQPPYQVDPRESGMERAIAASAKLVADEAKTSQCFQDSGIPLPGDPGYKGVCLPDANGRWLLDSHRQRLTHAEERMRYAHV